MILIYFLLASLYVAPESPKVSQGFQSWLSSKTPESQAKIWVFFTDKGIFKDSEYKKALKLAEQSLTSRARTRRLRVRKVGELCDFSDIPVCKEYVERIQKLGAKKCVISKWLNAVSLSFETSTKLISEIEAFPFVKEIRKVVIFRRKDDIRVEESKGINYGNCEEQLKVMNVPLAHDSGYSGNEVLIGVLDCGFDLRYHRCLQHLRDKVIAKYDFVGDDTILHYDPEDPADNNCGFSHGSRMLSLIAGAKSAEVVGPAYGCSLALARTELDRGDDILMEEHWWIAGTEYLDSIGVDIISNSLGYRKWVDYPDSTYRYSDMDGRTTPMSIVASMLASKGMLLVTVMANTKEENRPDTCIIVPADAESILAVGGVVKEENEWIWAQPGELSYTDYGSAIGPPYDSARFKPDVCAPWYGYQIDNPDSANSYAIYQGTSVATALVAGVCALVQEAYPTSGPMKIREVILNTASNHNAPNDTLGWGRPNAYEAIFVGIEEERQAENKKQEARLFQNQPNPSIKRTTISYHLPIKTKVSLKIYDMTGRIAKTLVNEEKESGYHEVNLHTKDLASGIYFAKIVAGDYKSTKKLILVR